MARTARTTTAELSDILSTARYDITMTRGEESVGHVPASLADIARIAGSGWTTHVHGMWQA